MTRSLSRLLCCLALLAAAPCFLQGQQPGASDDLKEYRTVETAITARISKAPAAGAATLPGYLGVHLARHGQGAAVAHLQPDSPAARAGLLEGDVVSRVAGQELAAPEDLKQLLLSKAAGESLKLEVLRGGKKLELTATLAPASQPLAADAGGAGGAKGKKGGSFDNRGLKGWSKPVYRLAVVLIEYPDAKPNPKITTKDWEDSLFSTGIYNGKSATGQKVYGSMNDHFLEQSYGTFRIEGKAFPYVQVSKKRAEYGAQGTSRQALLTEALDKLLARDGKDALKDFDGLFFMYAGDRMKVARGSLYWPHRSSVRHKDKSWPYFICPEGGSSMYNISVLSHEFGHMLGLPDLYARPENPGSEGLGQWCLMSNQTPAGRPQHMSAWCKERLGWIKPTVIDPTTPQKLILSPIYKSPKECYKVLVKPDGSEYFLLENRTAKGFDAALPAHGLLIWRVVGGRPVLEESHGVAGPAGPRSFATSVPFPSKANDAFTPFTVPSSRSQLGDGLPVHITNIRRLPDGRITFYIGWEFI